MINRLIFLLLINGLIFCNQFEFSRVSKGQVVNDFPFSYFTLPMENSNHELITLDSIVTKDYPNYLFLTCSPYTCGGCLRHYPQLVYDLLPNFPDQVFIVVSNWNRYDSIKALTKAGFNFKENILFDTDGRNILTLKKLDERYTDHWAIVMDKNKNIQFLLSINYEISLSSEQEYKFVVQSIKTLLEKVEK